MTHEIGNNNNKIMERGKDAPVVLRTAPKETFSKPTPNDHVNRRSKLSNQLQNYWTLLQKTKIPALLCILTYITICLLGNVVTGVIYFNHQNNLLRQTADEYSDYDHNDTKNESNETRILDASDEYIVEYGGEEDLNLAQLLFLNESIPVVSIKKIENSKVR